MTTLESQPGAEAATSLPRSVRIALNLTLLGFWLWLYRPVFAYLAILFTREEFRTNQVVLAGILLLVGMQLRHTRLRPRPDRLPQLSYPALALVLGSSIGFLLAERFLNINTLSGILFGLGTYGLVGLWLGPHRWRQGLPAALLMIGVLPFGEHMQTFIGYPMRTATAGIIRDSLSAVGVASVSVDTILIFENGVSQVDLPCSGVKSLWTGMLFLLAATWIERRSLNLRWLLSAAIFAGLLFAANLARVGILVVVGQVAGWELAAEMLHVPLGVLGFAAACAAVVAMLRWQPDLPLHPSRTATPPPESVRREIPRPLWLAPGLAVALLGMALLYTARPETPSGQQPSTYRFPSGMTVHSAPLSPVEMANLAQGGADAVERVRFEWGNISGSMILISSQTWRAHHRPERCFEVYGLTPKDSRPHLVSSDFPIQVLSLSYADDQGRLSAAYWFQTTGRTTEDYATRVWADMEPERSRWVLVTVLFDGVYDPNSPDLQTFYLALHDSLARSLEGENIQ